MLMELNEVYVEYVIISFFICVCWGEYFSGFNGFDVSYLYPEQSSTCPEMEMNAAFSVPIALFFL